MKFYLCFHFLSVGDLSALVFYLTWPVLKATLASEKGSNGGTGGDCQIFEMNGDLFTSEQL